MEDNKEMKKIEKMIVLTILVLSILSLTGCMNFIKSCIREDEEKAMERYLEEKYNDEFTCIDWHYSDGYNFFWNKSSFRGKFESAKYPGKIISVGGGVTEDKLHYTFCDDYQAQIYLDDVQEIMEKTAKKYFKGEHYLFIKSLGTDDETVEAMPFEEYITRWRKYRIFVFIDGINDEEAYQSMEEFIADIESQGFRSEFFLGKPNINIINKEQYFTRVETEENFDPWKSNGMECITIWLYEKPLSRTEEGEEN